MIAHNQSKIEELNRSLKNNGMHVSSPSFKKTRDMPVEGATSKKTST